MDLGILALTLTSALQNRTAQTVFHNGNRS